MHTWSDDDNLIAYCLYRFGDGDLGIGKKEIADVLGMSYASLNYKIGNFKSIDGQGGLDGYSVQAVRIYKQYNGLPDEQVKTAAQEALLRAAEKQVTTLKAKRTQQHVNMG